MKRNLYVGVGLLALVGVIGVRTTVLGKKAVVEAAGAQAPKFEVELMWPKPLPNRWVIGSVNGVSIDSKDHVWIAHRGASLEAKEVYSTSNSAECCTPAPPILEFDQEGNLVSHWGGPGQGYDWPDQVWGITVDYKGNVWIGGSGSGAAPAGRGGRGARGPAAAAPAADAPAAAAGGRGAGRGAGAGAGAGAAAGGRGAGGGRGGAAGAARGAAPAAPAATAVAPAAPVPYHDAMLLKFSSDGKFLMQIGKVGASKGNGDFENLKGPARFFVDKKTNELYVADGFGNRRVIVFDADSGKYKRSWGAYGNKPDDSYNAKYDPNGPAPKQFGNAVTCAELSNDGMVYVCDRENNRLQVFKADGTFVKETMIKKNTLGSGTVWAVAFSKDAAQKFLYVADGTNEKVHILDRNSLDLIASFGDGGRVPGEFYGVGSLAVDSKGNLYTAESLRGQRVQKFVYKGTANVASAELGVLRPKR